MPRLKLDEIDRRILRELQNELGIDRIGVSQPGLDLGHRELPRARRQRRAWCCGRQRAVAGGLIYLIGRERDGFVRSESGVEPGGAQHRVEPQ